MVAQLIARVARGLMLLMAGGPPGAVAGASPLPAAGAEQPARQASHSVQLAGRELAPLLSVERRLARYAAVLGGRTAIAMAN